MRGIRKNCPYCGRWNGRHKCPSRRRTTPRLGFLNKLRQSNGVAAAQPDIATPSTTTTAIYSQYVANNLTKSADPVRLDLNSDAWSDVLATGSVFEKSATVAARPAKIGEVITTVLDDGTVETSNVAGDGDLVVTNPGGESYLVTKEVFNKRYKETGTPGIFQAQGMVRAVPNPTGTQVAITAPWGEDMVGDKDCWIVEAVDTTDPASRSNDRYLIGGAEFVDTYRPKG